MPAPDNSGNTNKIAIATLAANECIRLAFIGHRLSFQIFRQCNIHIPIMVLASSIPGNGAKLSLPWPDGMEKAAAWRFYDLSAPDSRFITAGDTGT